MTLVASEVSVRFGGVAAVDGVSLELAQGRTLGLVGPNGSGKSTFLNAVTGLVSATGSVTVDGKQVRLSRIGAAAHHGVLRTFQTPQVHDELSCLENVLVGSPDRSWRSVGAAWAARPQMWRAERERWGIARAALEFVGLAHLADREARAMSYGERRLLELARAYVGRPRVLLMDEPAAGLNHVETAALADLLVRWRRESDLAVLVVEHKVDFLGSLCDELVVLDLGKRIASGPPSEVWRDPRVVEAYLGGEVGHA